MNLRPLRLASGLVMLAYLTLHLLAHMLGLVSQAVAEAGLHLTVVLWQSQPGTVLLYGAFAVHLVLALRTVYLRPHWRLPWIEWARLLAGFSLPLTLIGHAVGTRVATSFYGLDPTYERVVHGLINAGSRGWQVTLLAPGWVHGCLGLWLSLRHQPLMQRLRPVLLALLVAVPVLAFSGYLSLRREVSAHSVAAPGPAALERSRRLASLRQGLLGGYLLLVAGAVIGGRLAARRQG